MFGIFRKSPAPGGIDHAARRILELLELEEREKQEQRRLKAEGWQAPADSAPPAREPTPPKQPLRLRRPERRFGDGRDDLMQLVQSDLDRRQALQDEARRRAQLAQADAGVTIPPRKPAAPLPGSAGSDLPYAPINQGRNVSPQDRAKFRGALDARKSLSPAMRSIFDYVFDFEGGYKRTPGGSAVTGITQKTLDDYLDEFYKDNPEVHSAWLGKRVTPAELSDEQRIAFMQWHQDARMGDIDIGEIESPSRPNTVRDPKLAGMLYDAFYRYGKRPATRSVQAAINETMGRYQSDLAKQGARANVLDNIPRPIEPDGAPGMQTQDAILRLLNAGYGDALRAVIDDHIREERDGAKEANEFYRRSIFR